MKEPRQHNVQYQNDCARRAIRATAEHWRTHPVPQALRLCAEARGVNLATALILNLGIDDFPGMPHLFGTLLTEEGRFISFEIEADDHRLQVDEWLDVTHRQNLCRHNRGIGIGHGALAMDVLQALNAPPSAIPPLITE